MKFFKFPLSELGGRRLTRLTIALGVNTTEAIGFLLLFWHNTRSEGIEEARQEILQAHLPVLPHGKCEVQGMAALAMAGYIQHLSPGFYSVVDNAGIKDGMERVVLQCKKAAQARIAKKAAQPADAPKPVRAQRRTKAQMALVATQVTPAQDANRRTWEAYSEAYAARMGQPPVRNAKSNALIKQFVERLGHEDAPQVIAFFVHHPFKGYMARLYQLEMAIKDAESLRTQWARGAAVTKADFVHMEEQHAIDRERLRIARSE